AIDPLITALGDEDKYVRRRTASLLKYIAKNIEKPIPNNHPILNAIDPLITTLGDERMDVRKDSAIALKYIASKNQKFFDSKIKEKIVYKMRQEKNKEIKLILAQTLNILGEKKLDIVKETIDYDKSYNQKMNKILSRDIALLDEATKIINQMKIKRQMPEYYTYNGDLIALKFRVIDLLARGETKEKIYSKLKNYLKSTFRYNQYLPTIGTEVEIWDMFHAEWNESINELDPDFARIITLLFDINDSRDKLIEYCPDPNENFTSQMIILEKLRQYDLIVGKSEYPFHLSLGIKGDEEDKNIEKDGACIAYPLMILYTTNNRLDKGSTISNPNFVWKKEENRLEFRLFYFVNNVDNTGIIDSNPKFSYVHLLRDLQWLGSMLKAKYNGFNEKINKNLVDYFKNQYIPELEKIFNDVEINNDNKQRKILLELRNTTNIQQQCKALVDKTRNNIRAIINGESINLFLELQKNEDLSYKTPEEMKDIDATTQLGLSKLMHTAIIRPDEKPTQERIEAQKLSEDKLKEIYKNNPKLYGMTVKTLKYNGAEKQKPHIDKTDTHVKLSQKTLKPEGFLGHFLSGLRHKDKTVRDDARKSVFEGDDEEQKEKAAKSIISNMRYA
ncbi:MAG: hypothetical protein KAQ92_01880, partial [Candidatus Aenigmarchaeota archaeon]|nr:hypothetical protein [Candidatus Aenigmarchaeota archaeon]